MLFDIWKQALKLSAFAMQSTFTVVPKKSDSDACLFTIVK